MPRSLLLALISVLPACHAKEADAGLFSEGALGFKLEEQSSNEATSHRWRATWDSGGQHTQFDIVLIVPPPSDSGSFTFTNGWLLRHPPSESSFFLARLASLHETTVVQASFESRDSVPFTAVILGRDQSRAASTQEIRAGGFASRPPGPWLVTKLFFADGEAELFFNVNAKAGIAEFLPKDPEYGKLVISTLGSVLTAPR